MATSYDYCGISMAIVGIESGTPRMTDPKITGRKTRYTSRGGTNGALRGEQLSLRSLATCYECGALVEVAAS